MYCNKINFIWKWLLSFTLFLFCVNSVIAASARRIVEDSTKKSVSNVSALEKNKSLTSVGVIYPTVLKGNEEYANEYVENFSINRRSYLLRMYKKGKSFFPKITKTFKRHNLPQELKVLIALESAFNGNAVSYAGAVGYWQIMDEVAKEYGLKYIPQPTAEGKRLAEKNKLLSPDTAKAKKPSIKDERKNFHRSTQAAARYLKDRYRNLGNDILLVVASYNCGVGNVWEAIRKSGKSNASFWDIKTHLPAETRNYVMNFIAMNVVYHNYEKFAAGNLNFKVAVEQTTAK